MRLLLALALVACSSDYTEEGGASSSSSSSSSSSGSNPATTAGASSPGKVECGSEVCDLARQECCVESSSSFKCQDKGKGGCKGIASCDEAADCTEGRICCGSFSFSGGSGADCAKECSGITSAQTCRTDKECGSQGCVKQSCYGVTSFLCGLNPFCQRL